MDHASGPSGGRSRDVERLWAELSMRFINLPADQTDDAILDALQRIGEALDLDRCTFCRVHSDGAVRDAVGWEAPGIPPATVPAKDLFPWAFETTCAGGVVCFSSPDEIPNPVDRENHRLSGTRSGVTVPVRAAGELVGALSFNTVRQERHWLVEDVHRLRMIAASFGTLVTRPVNEAALRKELAEIERLRAQLQAESDCLRRETEDRVAAGIIVGQSPAMRQVLDQVRQVAATDSTVLLLGETGTGKELFATRIHELSGRRGRSMVRVNCAAIPTTLIESELYGREKGAFTGALARQAGRFELADRSTIFLDEIGDLPSEVQVKLLRVLEERQIERLGSPKSIRIDTRVIAATHRNLDQRIAEGMFREDLFYRLNVFPIQVPPLRERAEDIPLLVWRFVDEFSKAFGKRVDAIPRDNMAMLQQVLVAGEHSRASERCRARDDCRDRSAPQPGAAGRKPAGDEAQRQAGGCREGAHPQRAREHRLARPRRGRRR